MTEAGLLFSRLDELAAERGLSDRVSSVLYDACLGLRVRRSTYARDAGLKDGTATGDLRLLAAAGLPEAHGQTKTRTSTATDLLREVRQEVRASLGDAPVDPYAREPV